jgi:hypothetical protein
LGAGSLHAQSDGQYVDPFELPVGNFVGSAQAETTLGQQVVVLKDLIATLVPGTAAYKSAERAVFYYSTVQSEVVSGKDVPNSIVTGLKYVGEDAYGGATYSELLALRNESILMLAQ